MAEISEILKQIETQTAIYKSLLPLKPQDSERLHKKFRLEFNYNSNHIEGNTLTYGETELLLIFDQTKGNHEHREYEEMKAHDMALVMIEQEATDKERPLTEQFIRQLNDCLLVRPFWKEAITNDGQATRKQIIPGQYKTTPNSVRLQNGEIFHYASPDEVPIKMQELVDWYNQNSAVENPIFLAALLHYKFVCIHPFDDGNGRIARLLMNYVLLKNNYPMVVIKSDKKKEYLAALNHADVGEVDAFVNYIGEQLLWSLDLSIKAAKGESLEETGDYLKEIELIKRKVSRKENIVKSPKIVFETFCNIHDSVWPTVEITLKNFDELFSETRIAHFVNNSPEKIENTPGTNSIVNAFKDAVSSISLLPIKPNTPTDFKIWGYNMTDVQINNIHWVKNFIGLRGAKKNIEYIIALFINFNLNNYLISVVINSIVVFNLTKDYSDSILSEEIKQLNGAIPPPLLEQIKKDLHS